MTKKELEIIDKIEAARLVGRGGACYPTADKWKAVKEAKGEMKYVVANGSEGEPGVKKDLWVLTRHPERLADGMALAMEFLGAKEGILYLNPDYYDILHRKLEPILSKRGIRIFRKPHIAGYAGGEETSALNALEGRRIEPRLKPPYPPTNGLWDQPTLVNNIETFYAVSRIADGSYENKRLFTLGGDIIHDGVFELDENMTIEEVLKNTENYPNYDFFVQVGGDASGECLNSSQLKRPVSGSGSITVYSLLKHKPLELIRHWAEFFRQESCGQCVPCREGTWRLTGLLAEKNIDWKSVSLILDTLRDTSFCGLGCAAPIAIRSFVNNVLPDWSEHSIGLSPEEHKIVCECFK